MEQERNNVFQQLQKTGDFSIEPISDVYEYFDSNRYMKLEQSQARSRQLSVMLQELPLVLAADAMTKGYTVSFPKGLPHTLTALKQGGVGSMIRENGRFVGSASFFEMSTQAALLNAFTAVSFATGQYFMSQINSEMKLMNQKMDKIIEFLYGDKRAELMASIGFVQYVNQNFVSIMEHEVQRAATIGSLQSAKMVAMKDIEFYLEDLQAKVSEEVKSFSSLENSVHNVMQICDSLEMSMQLYAMSGLLEMQVAQNMDESYIQNLETEMLFYIEKCEKRMLSSLSTLKGRVDSFKQIVAVKNDKTHMQKLVGEAIDSLNRGSESSIRKAIRYAMHEPAKSAKYFVNKDGEVYALRAG